MNLTNGLKINKSEKREWYIDEKTKEIINHERLPYLHSKYSNLIVCLTYDIWGVLGLALSRQTDRDNRLDVSPFDYFSIMDFNRWDGYPDKVWVLNTSKYEMIILVSYYIHALGSFEYKLYKLSSEDASLQILDSEDVNVIEYDEKENLEIIAFIKNMKPTLEFRHNKRHTEVDLENCGYKLSVDIKTFLAYPAKYCNGGMYIRLNIMGTTVALKPFMINGLYTDDNPCPLIDTAFIKLGQKSGVRLLFRHGIDNWLVTIPLDKTSSNTPKVLFRYIEPSEDGKLIELCPDCGGIKGVPKSHIKNAEDYVISSITNMI